MAVSGPTGGDNPAGAAPGPAGEMSETFEQASQAFIPRGEHASGMAAAMQRMRARRGGALSDQTSTPTSLEANQPPQRPVAAELGDERSQTSQDDDDVLALLGEDDPSERTPGPVPGPDDDDPVVFDLDGAPIRRSEARNGYMRRADYSQKTDATAQRDRELEARFAEVAAHRDRYAGLLESQLSWLGELGPKQPDIALKASDPVAYAEQVSDYLMHQQVVQQKNAELQQVRAEQQADAQRRFVAKQMAERDKAIELIPSLRRLKNDPPKLQRALNVYREFAKSIGYTDGELAQIADHRVFRALDAAVRGVALMRRVQNGGSSVSAAEGPARDAGGRFVSSSPVLKRTGGGGGFNGAGSGSAQVEADRALAQLNRSGSRSDAVKAYQARKRIVAARGGPPQRR